MLRVAYIALLSAALAGCGATIAGELLAPAGTPLGKFKQCLQANGFVAKPEDVTFATIQARLTAGIIPIRYDSEGIADGDFSQAAETQRLKARAVTKGWVSKYLDCYLSAPVDMTDIEGRLLRGHIVLTLLSEYGQASLAAKNRVSKPDDAISMIGHIKRAQLYLLSASPNGLQAVYGLKGTSSDGSPYVSDFNSAVQTMGGLTAGDLPNFHNAQRVAAVFDVGLDVARVDGRYVGDIVGSAFDIVSGAVASGGFSLAAALPKLQNIMKGVTAGLQLVAANMWYGPPMIDDAALSLLVADSSATTPISTAAGIYRNTGKGWLYWNRRLTASCQALQTLANDKKTACLPTAAEMADFIEAEYGSDHPLLAALRKKALDDAVKKAKAAAAGN